MIYKPDQTDLTFYVTQNGGLTWNGDPGDPTKVIKPGLPAFADALHAWSWDGGTSLFISTDGTQTWKGNNPNPALSGDLSQLQFVAAPAGRFTGWALTRVGEDGHSQLYRTTDGSTWTSLIP